MIQVFENIYCGSQADYESIASSDEWAVLHCCKEPHHRKLAGYSGQALPQSHLHYPYIIKGHRMALNLVDMDTFSSKFAEFNYKMFSDAFDFLNQWRTERNLLIHCNQGESRGPSLALLYISTLGAFGYAGFEESKVAFVKIYPRFNPKRNILTNVQLHWERFVTPKIPQDTSD